MKENAWLVVAAVVVGLGAIGATACAVDTASEIHAPEVTERTSTIVDNLVVDAKALSDGSVWVDARRPAGDRVLAYVVQGGQLHLQLLDGHRKGETTVPFPQDRAKRVTLAQWTALAKAFDDTTVDPSSVQATWRSSL